MAKAQPGSPRLNSPVPGSRAAQEEAPEALLPESSAPRLPKLASWTPSSVRVTPASSELSQLLSTGGFFRSPCPWAAGTGGEEGAELGVWEAPAKQEAPWQSSPPLHRPAWKWHPKPPRLLPAAQKQFVLQELKGALGNTAPWQVVGLHRTLWQLLTEQPHPGLSVKVPIALGGMMSPSGGHKQLAGRKAPQEGVEEEDPPQVTSAVRTF